MLVYIPHAASYIIIDEEGLVFATNGVRSKKSLFIGICKKLSKPKIIRLPKIVKNESRFLTTTLKIVDNKNVPYEERVLENFIIGNRETREFEDDTDIPF